MCNTMSAGCGNPPKYPTKPNVPNGRLRTKPNVSCFLIQFMGAAEIKKMQYITYLEAVHTRF